MVGIIDIERPTPVEKFYKFIELNWWRMLGSKMWRTP